MLVDLIKFDLITSSDFVYIREQEILPHMQYAINYNTVRVPIKWWELYSENLCYVDFVDKSIWCFCYYKLGLPISDVEFPSVVICSEGFDLDAITAVIFGNVFMNMDTSTYKKLGLSPLQCAKLMRKHGVSIKRVFHK
jgi:hypothetical protein